jgi:hypothetical protein
MSLKDELQKIYDEEGKLKGQEDVETPEDEEVQEVEQEEAPEGTDEQGEEAPSGEEKPEEAPKEEAKKEEKPDNAAFARMRLEANEWRRKAEEAERKLREREEKAARPAQEEAPAQESASNPEIDEILEEHKFKAAAVEFQHWESQFAANAPDYEDVAQQYFTALTQNIKQQNPNLPDYEVVRRAQRSIIQKASVYYNAGMNPAQALYTEAKTYGFGAKEQPQEEAKQQQQPKQQVKPPVKSAGMVGARGGSAQQPSHKKDFADGKMSLSDFSKLTPEQLAQLDAR